MTQFILLLLYNVSYTVCVGCTAHRNLFVLNYNNDYVLVKLDLQRVKADTHDGKINNSSYLFKIYYIKYIFEIKYH